MNMDNAEQPKNVAQRFADIATSRDYRRVEGSETIPVDELPVFVRLGQVALNTLVILNPITDLTERERSGETSSLNPAIKTYIIDPNVYDFASGKGYKALRKGEDVTFGRMRQDSRFDGFTNTVSRNHVNISKSPDGKFITVEDLISTNGTYLSTSSSAQETGTEQYLPPTGGESNKELVVYDAQAASVASERHPDSNEDKFIVDRTNNLYAVFDGVGGISGGEVASEAARSYISERAGSVTTGNLATVEGQLRLLLADANKSILKLSSEAATTAVVTKVHRVQGELYASVAHVGDSRAYRFRENKYLEVLTTDHTPFRHNGRTGEAALQQERLANTDRLDILSEDDIAAFRHRNIIGASLGGGSEARVDVKHFRVERGDLIVLTSDGIHDNLTTQEMQDVLSGALGFDHANQLIQASVKRSQSSHIRAKKDDMTALVINI